MSRPPIIDAHTHVVPDELVELAAAGTAGFEKVELADGTRAIRLADGYEHPIGEAFSDVAAKLQEMDCDGIDLAVCSISPSLILPVEDPGAAREACAAANEGIGRMATRSGGRILPLAALPLADPDAAASELARAAHAGFAGALVGTGAPGAMPGGERLEPLLAAASAHRMPLLMHPYRSMISRAPFDLAPFHLANVAGNPHETFVAAAHLIMSGALDRHPELRVILVHGGGTLPYQIGRLDHAHSCGPKPGRIERQSPAEYLDRLLFDSIVYEPEALGFLLARVGAGGVLFGTDRPFDMSDTAAIQQLKERHPDVADAVLGTNALSVFRIASAGR